MRREIYGIIFWGDFRRKKERCFDENIDRIGLKNLSPEELEQIKDIIYSMNSANISQSGFYILLKALMEQNWLLMRKLDSIDRNLKELNNK